MLIETTLPQDKRKDLEHHEYGVSDTKQFPLHDKVHVRKAIQMFRFAKGEHRKELAFKLKLKADKYNIDIHKEHPLHTYLKEECLEEKGFALTARYAGHRLLNASISNTLLQSVRVSLEKTVNGTTDPEDLQYLRQDMYMGKVDLAKRLARSTDAKQTKEIKEHLEWLSGPYTAMINKRAKELRSSLTEQLLAENKEAKKKGSINTALQTVIIRRNLEKMSDSGNEKLKDYSTRLDKAKTKEEKLLIAEEIKNNIKELESIKNDKDTSMVLRSLQVVGGIIIVIPGSFLMLGGGLIMLASSPLLILGGLIMALAGNAMALGGYLMSSKEVENKSMDKVLDIMITKHEKLLAKAK
jgi:hypothetical protein